MFYKFQEMLDDVDDDGSGEIDFDELKNLIENRLNIIVDQPIKPLNDIARTIDLIPKGQSGNSNVAARAVFLEFGKDHFGIWKLPFMS